MIISLRTLVKRCAIIIFWLSMIFALLYAPLFTRFLYQQKSLNLFIWPMILDARILAEFEKETGIKVYLNYYESNEELYSKLKATKGEGYDLIVPTDYTVELLINDGLVKKLDQDKLPFIARIKPYLMNNYHDSGNNYSIPYYMSIFGLGVNKEQMTNFPITWGMVFDKKQVRSRICMVDSPREAILLAAHYLYGTIDNAADHLPEIAKLLITQKKWVEVYTSARIEELLASGSCNVAVGTSPDVWKASREYGHIEFMMPAEGSFVTIDSFVIPITTEKDEMIYQLLNFLYRKEILEKNCRHFGFCPPTDDVVINDPGIFCPTTEQFKKLDFFRNVLTKKQMQDVWILVKSK